MEYFRKISILILFITVIGCSPAQPIAPTISPTPTFEDLIPLAKDPINVLKGYGYTEAPPQSQRNCESIYYIQEAHSCKLLNKKDMSKFILADDKTMVFIHFNGDPEEKIGTLFGIVDEIFGSKNISSWMKERVSQPGLTQEEDNTIDGYSIQIRGIKSYFIIRISPYPKNYQFRLMDNGTFGDF